MELDYDQKFEEMKKYIPFLESMIKRLESSNNGVKNPRKAQLDKIRSLRDLLLDKKKRMKMENLLKCEQVLVNLYAKVEQRDSMADNKEDCIEQNQKEKSDLNIVRNKLKSVVSKLQDDDPETLPEIARATNTEVVCTPGSKEPALFQRRPNKASSPCQSPNSHNDDNSSNSKRHYTRVLMSPEHKKKDWLATSDVNADKPLFSRRSPRRSPRRYSPSYKKERKKSSKQRSKSSQQSKDLNITLKVPEESLSSLNTKDILSRIINCSDNDVDIATLRGLRSQILGELKQTGTKDDISDLILKSYKKKDKTSRKNEEVEEGELSDSESEAIENIYGSLVVVNPGENTSNANKMSSDKKPRKIQICLVINSDKEKDSKVHDLTQNDNLDITDFEPYTEPQIQSKTTSETEDKILKEISSTQVSEKEKNLPADEIKNVKKSVEESYKSPKKDNIGTENDKSTDAKIKKISSENLTNCTATYKPNFYQLVTDENKNLEESLMKQNPCKSRNGDNDNTKEKVVSKPLEAVSDTETSDSNTKVKIKKVVVSEIDILQALKNEILGETTVVPVSEAITPPLHQPKITKVASAQELVSKKRISIEKYKQKSIPSIKQPLFTSITKSSSSKDDNLKKQSLKLTEKECERFNFPDNVSPVDSSEDEDKSSSDFEFLSGQSAHNEFRRDSSAPKSPDHEDFADTGIRPPVIIPSDPVKNIVVNVKSDIDMRTLIPLVSPLTLDDSRKSITSPSITSETAHKLTWNEQNNSNEQIRKRIPNLRMRKESNQSTVNDSPNSCLLETDRLSRATTSYSNVPPSMSPNISSNIPPLMSLNIAPHMTSMQNSNIVPNMNPIMAPMLNSNIPLILNPNMTPNINPNMTPSRMVPSMNPMMTPILTPNARSYEMTPRPNFENEDYTGQKHVYAPIFPTYEQHDFLETETFANRNDRYLGEKRLDSPQIRMECPSTPNPSFGRLECPSTPNPSFGRMDCPLTPNPSFGRMECPLTPNPSFGRMECPPTPNPSFGRMECPPTPNPSFGRMECPPTPNSSFGRMDCPPTPNPSFGRMDCPSTPNPSFGRMETPMTPVHSFGRSDRAMTPSHSFGRSDHKVTSKNVFGRGDYHHNVSSSSHKYIKSQDPRLNRTSEYDKYQSQKEERNRYFDDDKVIENTNTLRKGQIKPYEQDRHTRDRKSHRESSIGPCFTRSYENDDVSNKDYYNSDYQYRREKFKPSDDGNRKYRARSIGRINPSEDKFSTHKEGAMTKTYTREDSIEKPISVQSHTGRSFNIDTSFNRTFQETTSKSGHTSFDLRRQRASSVGRSLRDCPREDSKRTSANQNKFILEVSNYKNAQFRRASSVGRDLRDYNRDKNFKDIKEDLRSCKFNNYNFDQRDQKYKEKSRMSNANENIFKEKHHITRVNDKTYSKSNEDRINRDPRRRPRDYDLNINKVDESYKYSPRKNIRDPRMRREIEENTKNDKYKGKDKNSSSSRYKNYGIVYSNDNIAKGTILASAAGVKNFKIPKIKRSTEEKQIETINQNETDINKEKSLKITKNEENSTTNKNIKPESKLTKSEVSSGDERCEIENINKTVTIKLDKPKLKDQYKNYDINIDSASSLSDSCEKRITRSSLKSGTLLKQISKTSSQRKLRRIRKPLISDSDSDTQEKEIIENKNKNVTENKKSQIKQDTEKDKNNPNSNDEIVEKLSNKKQADETKPLKPIDSTNEDDTIINPINKNNTHEYKESNIPVVTNETCEEQSDSLDISFGVDDELFSDNIASGSVLDNINALIADLDHDIEAPKINDFNDKFINNIMGKMSSNKSLTSLHGNQTDLATDRLSEKLGFVVDIQNTVTCSSAQIISNKNNMNTEINKSKNNHEDLTNSSRHKSHISNEIKEMSDTIAKVTPVSENSEIIDQQNNIKSTTNIQDDNKTLNGDAIVSTTAYDEKGDEILNDPHCSNIRNEPSVCPFVPDSTNNSTENINDKDSHRSYPDSTNEITSEMNITSTHIDVSTRDQSGATSTCDSLPRIDSIGKLLSILEDKNKIKELLTLLSKDSGENEKIKKKLEKLSEIVSDDEETSREVNKDNDGQEKAMLENESNKKEIGIEKTSHLENKSESLVDNDKVDKESHDNKSVFEVTVQNDSELRCNRETLINNEQNERIDKKLCESMNQLNNIDSDIAVQVQEKDILSNDVLVNINKVVANKTTDSNNDNNIDKTVAKNELPKQFKDVRVTVQDTIEPISTVNVKENPTVDTQSVPQKSGKKITKKSKTTKKGRSRLAKKLSLNKRVTRSEAGGSQPQILPVPKKPSRELLKLQEDIRDMFISQDILNATGIRMCRLAKLVDDKHQKGDASTSEVVDSEPIVVLENIKSQICPEESLNSIEKTKKNKSKSKQNSNNETFIDQESRGKPKHKPGPKSKTKRQDDPYLFETESIGESNNTVDSKDQNVGYDSDSVSTKSFASSELLVDLKKKTKRKRGSWQLGVIKKKGVKNKSIVKHNEVPLPGTEEDSTYETKEKNGGKIPDINCFTDKSYCFYKNVKNYLCRLCGYHGTDIVPHYKKHHPHSEIPLSRLSPATAKEAISQCENMNLQAISKIQTKMYVCRFCFQEFHKQNTALETFFWHVVSVHTGEYKHLCSECINVTRCPFNLDIPPPPKNLKGQLIGYICGRCNFTQVSLENLKTHVIIRHDDEQTEVYSINLGEIPKKALQSLISKANESSVEGFRVLRSTRSNPSITEPSDDRSDVTDSTEHIVSLDTSSDNVVQETSTHFSNVTPKNKIQSKLIFENDDTSDISNYSKNNENLNSSIKMERDDDSRDCDRNKIIEETIEAHPEANPQKEITNNVENIDIQTELSPSTDVLDYPHFKIKLSGTGTKEYICCINGIENHYKTTLLISLKKHVQLKHAENWDGYCFVCKVIVTSQGKHKFKDCLQHFLDKHIDNFPILNEVPEPNIEDSTELVHAPSPVPDEPLSKTYINVRPLSELISSEQRETQEVIPSMPKIQSVVSLGASDTPDAPNNSEPQKDVKACNYEEAQAEVMTKKHRVVLEAMLTPEKLIQVFKCAGRFCSYTTDKAEEALLHASAHQRIGGEGSLKCSYCDFDSLGNAIDLVMHVFKNYGHCSYACSKCFYRAAVSQLVYAHIKRVHPELDADKVPVLSSATVMKDNSKDDLMSRDSAVLYYVCNNKDPEEGGICQFKSYVLTKFREHLQTRHANDQEYSCYICNTSTPLAKLLAQHLKSHGLRIYQCCRCLFGADNEADLMAHASEKHPLKQPKAYLRIITSKGGSSEVRVLPLAVLSKSTVESTIVTSSTDNESPVKQAERSIDLEKLIGQINVMIESKSTITNSATIEPVDVSANENEIQLENEQESSLASQEDSENTAPAVLTLLTEQQDTSDKMVTVVKSEPETVNSDTKNKNSVIPLDTPASASADPDVVCLDSDDENSRQNIIDLSGEDTPPDSITSQNEVQSTNVKIPRSLLYKCSKCFVISKSEGMFKRHLISCFPTLNELIKCAHCSWSSPANSIVIHYNNIHSENTASFICAICNGKFISVKVAKKHMKLIHNETSTVVKTKPSSTGALQYIINSDFKERQAPKRKLSSETGSKNSEPLHKLKKYGPQDVDKLPINPILDDLVYCSLCEFSTKVRLNMVRHLQLHAEQQPVPRTAPVNPVPHLESNEKHFDKMLNLASSSITTINKTVLLLEHLSPEAAAMYPKYVPDRHRYTCGAKACSYISVNETMFKIHWETLHAGTNDYHCVHCPPHQHLDTSKPLTAVRIIAHLKMHDMNLYACSSCTFYHNTRKVIEKHLREVHNGKLIIVREDGATSLPTPPASVQPCNAPTMDLKPWQCGLCKFKSMLRPAVIEHCGRLHQSKMQFKCTYCGFRTSNIENISNHQSKQHPGKKEEVFYFYYREGSIPDEADGTARWQKQLQKSEPEIKMEADASPADLAAILPKTAAAKPQCNVDLVIVKKEIVESETNIQTEESVEELCKVYGQFCDPNGLRYKCSLCKLVIEDTKEAMQSHLYEELQYRKWGCALCFYKAFHKPGLQQHVEKEHKHSRVSRDPVELQIDNRIETWVTKLLEHQTLIIERHKENLAKQKAEILRANPGSTAKVSEKPVEPSSSAGTKSNVSMAELEKLFGPFGVPSNMNYTCPKCNISAKTEAVMQEHLERELNKIRWCCSTCGDTFQSYHEAQIHCRSLVDGQSSRPIEATRDVTLRAAWVSAVLRVQKLSMNIMPVTETHTTETTAQPTDNTPENSLLVVRYVEKVPTPEEQMKLQNKSDKEGDKLVSEDNEKKKTIDIFECKICYAIYKYESFYNNHVLKHYGLKPFSCPYCTHTDHRKAMETHITNEHPNRSIICYNTPIPTDAPVSTSTSTESNSIICLRCEETMSRAQSLSHYHDNVRPQFGIKGSLVYRCGHCLTLHKTSNDFNLHYKQFHSNEKKNSTFYKLNDEGRLLLCSPCNRSFVNMAQYRLHQQLNHGLKSFAANKPTDSKSLVEQDNEVGAGEKRKADDSMNLPAPKRVARKSTTKLPCVMAVAKKSTTKLPFEAPCDVDEYSYYGTKPSMENLDNVTTLMPFYNTFVPFTLKKLSEIIKIDPVVAVKDISDKK